MNRLSDASTGVNAGADPGVNEGAGPGANTDPNTDADTDADTDANCPSSPQDRVVTPPQGRSPDALAITRSLSVEATPAHGLAEPIGLGDILDGHRIEERLGEGGMGEVFAATHLESGERVALKVLHTTSPTLLYRFKREFRALADIHHPNLISLRQLCVPHDGPAFFTMELVEGQRFDDYVRQGRAEGVLPERERLEDALRQLARGVHHLHEARCIHRDLKPSNVLVTAQGRVVILDFGLVFEQVSLGAGVTHDGQLLGTPAYMAPEQAAARAGPEVDYYAIGVMLYQCLAGRLPFYGPAMKILLLKQDSDAPDPAAGGLAVPEPLRAICRQLLQRDPARRLTGRELLERLDGDGAGPTGRALEDSRIEPRIPFVGREQEQAALMTALRRVQELGMAVTVHVHGRSGYGKSALLRRLLARIRHDQGALVLHGRCFERETVPYKGVDAVVDALSVHLRRMPPEPLAELRPRHVGPLRQLFPVLDGIWEEGASAVARGELEPSDLRRLGLAALREILVRLGQRSTLVVAIDDLQWANVDGVNLLTALMRPPEPPALLLLLAFRDESADNPVLGALTAPAALADRDVRSVPVGPLSDESALELARALSRDRARDPARARQVVHRAQGSPFFIGQMSADARPLSGSVTTLDGFVDLRVTDLQPRAHTVLACIAVAGGPIPVEVVAEVVDEPSVEEPLGELRARGMLASGSEPAAQGSSIVETAHDRIREVVLEGLDPERRRALHRGLGEALERRGADPETLADHYRQGGAPRRAATHTERAAELAAQTLAFARAVDFYRRTLELLPAEGSHDHRERLRRALVLQLINVGRRSEAAELLLELAGEASPSDAASLRRQAAHQLARSGRIDEAIALTFDLLRAMGEPVPRTLRTTLWMFLRARLRLWLRGWRYTLRPEAQIPRAQLDHLDTLLILIDGEQEVLFATALHAHALPLALDVGEPRRLGMALGHEMAIQAAMGRLGRAKELHVEGRELAALVDDIELDLSIEMGRINIDYVTYRFAQARERLSRFLVRLDEVPSAGWMRSNLIVRYVQACLAVGRWAELRRELPGWTTVARDQGNLHEVASLEAYSATVALRYGDIDAARRHLEAAQAVWAPSSYTFTSVFVDQAELDVLLFTGEPSRALDRLDTLAGMLRRAGLHRFRMLDDWLARSRLRAWLLLALEQSSAPALESRIRRQCRRLARSPDPFSRGDAWLSEAALATRDGDIEQARRLWRRALDHFLDCGLRANVTATRVRLASVTSRHEAHRLRALADEYFAEEGIEQRERFVETFAPAAEGFGREPG